MFSRALVCFVPLEGVGVETLRSPGVSPSRVRTLPIKRHDPSSEHRPISADLLRSGSYSVPSASACRERGEIRGVKKSDSPALSPTHVPKS
jgi:hypothetical protein